MIAVVALCLVAGADSASVLGDLERLDRDLVKTELHLQELASDSTTLVVNIAGLAAEQATATVREQEAYANFSLRLRALARMPVGARAVLLGQARSLADYLETSRVLRWVAAHDRALHDQYVAEQLRLEIVRRGIAEREQRLQVTMAAVRSERDQLARTRQERVELLRNLWTTRSEVDGTMTEQRLARSSMVQMLRKMVPFGQQSETFAKNLGRLPWPTAGRRGTGFGDTMDPHFGTVVSHPGLDILAQSGTPVVSVAAGNVVFAGWLKGYGQLVIIDHGDEYHTLYAYLAAVKVVAGDTVAAGAVIGAVGDTGSLSGTHLYFELRHQGVAENPNDWLRH